MSKTVRRILIAALCSASGFAATITWYKLSENKDANTNNSKPIARLVSTVNEVQKKSVLKIIWEPINDNEVLRIGEAIRTAANAEARIEFLNSATIIDLEPDSAIIIEENDGKLSLDFLKGNIQVKANLAEGQGDSGITLKSGDKKIALGKSEFTLGKNKTGDLDVNILKGDLTGLNGVNSDKIKVLSPLPNEPLYVNPAANELAQIQWQPLPVGYQVFIEAGTTRDDLKPVPGALGPGEKGQLAANMTFGKIFFRLVAKSKNSAQPDLSSPVLRSTVLAKLPPVPLSPENESLVSVNTTEPDLNLLWSNPAGFSQVIIEIASTPDLKKIIKTEYLENITTYSFKPEKNGMYYWRVSGLLTGKKEVVSSKIQSFKLTVLNEISPPELEYPKQNDKFPTESLKERGLVMSWKASSGAERYKITVEKSAEKSAPGNGRNPATKEKIFEDEARTLQASVKNLKSGTYTWTVTSISAKGEASKPSEVRTFTLQSLPIINWADGKTAEEQYYISLKPSMTLKWEKGDPKATNWIVRIYDDKTELNPIVKKLTNTGAEILLPRDGQYLAEVEAYDGRENLLARSQKREMKIASAPLLPAPQYATNTPNEIEASGSGTASIQWDEVQGANQYVIEIKTADGKTSKEYNFKSKNGSLNGLMPGEYKISLRSVDEHGRSGPSGEERVLKVPSQSNVRAPKLKGVKVK